MTTIDYAKYENMNRQKLVNSLSLAEKRERKIKDNLALNNELIKFLKVKIKESLNEKTSIPFEESNSYKKFENFNLNQNEMNGILKDLRKEKGKRYED